MNIFYLCHVTLKNQQRRRHKDTENEREKEETRDREKSGGSKYFVKKNSVSLKGSCLWRILLRCFFLYFLSFFCFNPRSTTVGQLPQLTRDEDYDKIQPCVHDKAKLWDDKHRVTIVWSDKRVSGLYNDRTSASRSFVCIKRKDRR